MSPGAWIYISIGLAMELSDSSGEFSDEEMDVGSEMSPGSSCKKEVKPYGSSCSSGMDLGDSEQEGELVGSISLPASSEEERGGDEMMDGVDLEMCSAQGASCSNSWRPGVDCGLYITGRDAPPQVQAQVLMANVYLNLKRLPASIAKAVWSSLTPGAPCIVRNFADRLASKLMGISHSLSRKIHDRARAATIGCLLGQQVFRQLLPQQSNRHRIAASELCGP